MENMIGLIRLDANSIIGSGHMMRCLSIAVALRERGKLTPVFVTADREPEPVIRRFGFECHVLETDYRAMFQEMERIRKLVRKYRPRFMLTDSYQASAEYFRGLRKLFREENVDCKLWYMDDVQYPDFDVDGIINYNVYAKREDYARSTHLPCLIMGKRYIPLRKEFQKVKCRFNNTVSKVLITSGGADKYNACYKIAQALSAKYPETEFNVVSGAYNSFLSSLRELEKERKNIKIHVNVKNMAELMLECDCAVSAAGSTIYELCALGLPTVLFYFVDNQELIASAMKQEAGIVNAGNYAKNPECVLQMIEQVFEEWNCNPECRAMLQTRMRSVVDGYGAQRIAIKLEEVMINFNVPPFTGKEMEYIREAVENQKICGDGPFTGKCHQWMEDKTKTAKALLTTSCTHALEMAAILSGVGEGDEVIMPSYTFVSTADAFVLRGAKIVFVDIRPDTMNIDEKKIEDAITPATKGIVVVHYAGVACEMNEIMRIASEHDLFVVEDAAQGIMSEYHGKALGTFGDFGCYSFHETKNYSMGEGGALLIRDDKYIEDAEIIREKGTNRSKYYRGQIDKYTWIDYGSSYLPSDMNAAYLWAQLEMADEMNNKRLLLWERYDKLLKPLEEKGVLQLPYVPKHCKHNAHMYYIKAKDLQERTELIAFMAKEGVMTPFHYVPLHTSPAGLKYGRFHGEDVYTTKESDRLLRLPMYYTLELEQVDYIVEKIKEFYRI